MIPYNGHLNSNELRTGLFNRILSHTIFSNVIKHAYSGVRKKNTIEGGLDGDTHVFTFGEGLPTRFWKGINEDVIKYYVNDTFLDVDVKIDTWFINSDTKLPVFDKRAWTSGNYVNFISLSNKLMRDKIEAELTMRYNVYLGTHECEACVKAGASMNPNVVGHINLTLPVGNTIEETDRLEANYINMELANLVADLKDYTTKYNAYGFEYSFDESDLDVILNPKFANKFTKVDIPTIFNKPALELSGDQIQPRCFGDINTSATYGDGSTVRFADHYEITSGGTTTYFKAGDLVPTTVEAPAGKSYTEKDDIAMIVMVKGNLPFMNGTNIEDVQHFAANQTDTTHAIVGCNTLKALGLPYIRVRVSKSKDVQPIQIVDVTPTPETPGEGE